MKKEYQIPKAEMVAFDYTDTVVASNTAKQSGTKCIDPCAQQSKQSGSKCTNPCGKTNGSWWGWGWGWGCW